MLTRVFSLVVLVAAMVTGCQTIPYNPKTVSVLEAYGEVVDLHIVTVGIAWENCYRALGDVDRSMIDQVHNRGEALSADQKAIYAACNGAFSDEFQTFYDTWGSKLFTAQQQTFAGDIIGICEEAGKHAVQFAATVSNKEVRNNISSINFDEDKGCSHATIGGVIAQHSQLREFHSEFNVIDRDQGKFWRETIAQSVRIALTVENFKKAAAEDSGSLL